MMNRTFAKIGLVLAFAAAFPVAASAQSREPRKPVVVGPSQAFVINNDFWFPEPLTVQGRKDVLEVSIPPPPRGPVTPSPFCMAWRPTCR